MDMFFKQLREAIPYLRAYRGSVFVVKLDKELLAVDGARNNVTEQLALLHFLGVKLILVHSDHTGLETGSVPDAPAACPARHSPGTG